MKLRSLKKRLSNERRSRLMQVARRFHLDMKRKKWCDLWHTHFDWDGEGAASIHIHREFIRAHFIAFRAARRELADYGAHSQLFLAIYPNDPESDALYVHTENPNTPFPFDFGDVLLLDHSPWILRGFADTSLHTIFVTRESDQRCYLIQYK